MDLPECNTTTIAFLHRWAMKQSEWEKLLKDRPDIQYEDQSNEPTPAQKQLRSAARRAARDNLSIPFERLWKLLDGPELDKEFQFFRHGGRQWKTDYTHHATKTMIELEGAIFLEKSGHKGAGQIDDMRKYNQARCEGYQVFTLGTSMITEKDVRPIIEHIRRKEAQP